MPKNHDPLDCDVKLLPLPTQERVMNTIFHAHQAVVETLPYIP